MTRKNKMPVSLGESLVVYRPPGPRERLLLRVDAATVMRTEILRGLGLEPRSEYGGFLRGLAKRSVLLRIGTDALVLACFSLCLACFCAFREGGMDL